MSEQLQDDDPDPQPGAKEKYPINWQTGLAFDDYELAEYYAEEHRYSLEREAVIRLSARADDIIESELGEGDVAKRRVVTENAELYRIIIGNDKKQFTFIDTLEDRRRCRAWTVGDSGVSWCEHEQRYEPAEEVLARLEAMFRLDEAANGHEGTKQVGHFGERLKRLLGMAVLK